MLQSLGRLRSSRERKWTGLKMCFILGSLDNKMEWLKTFERVKDIEKKLIWPALVDVNSTKLYLPEVCNV